MMIEFMAGAVAAFVGGCVGFALGYAWAIDTMRGRSR